MINRIGFSIVMFGCLIVIMRHSYIHLIDINPVGWKWYLANAIIQVVIWWGFCMFIVWKWIPIRKQEK